MYGDRENENMNFDSIPNIAFNSNGEPVTKFNSDDGPKSANGQFIPPAGLDVDDTNNNDFNFDKSVSVNNDNNRSTNNIESSNVVGGDFNMFKCNHCNTTFGVSKGGAVNECIMCHEHNLTNVNYTDNYISGFVPFTISKSTAVDNYKSKVMLNPVIPFCFKSAAAINSIKKVYVPGYLYDTLTSGETFFLGVDETPNGKVKFDVKFNNSVEHTNIYHKATSKIGERVFNAIANYKFNNINDFDPNNIGQCYYLEPNLNKADITLKVEDNCKKHIVALSRRKVKHTMKKAQGDTLRTEIKNVRNILVPVYLLNINYNSKDYMFIMNGETGESSLDVTYGKLEMFIFGLVVALVVFGISVLISMFL